MILVPLRRTFDTRVWRVVFLCVCRFDFVFAALLICNDAGIFVCIEYQVVALSSFRRVYQMQTICFFDDVVSVVVVDIVVVVVVAVAYVLFIWLKRNHKSGPSLTL